MTAAARTLSESATALSYPYLHSRGIIRVIILLKETRCLQGGRDRLLVRVRRGVAKNGKEIGDRIVAVPDAQRVRLRVKHPLVKRNERVRGEEQVDVFLGNAK